MTRRLAPALVLVVGGDRMWHRGAERRPGSGCRRDGRPAGAGLRVTDPWVRPSPPGADEAAIYLRIDNESDVPDSLLGSNSPACLSTHLHMTSEDSQGVSSMDPLTGAYEIAAHSTLELDPLGIHVMCVELADPLVEGASFPLNLWFERAGKVVVEVAVEQRVDG
ncbi:MAG: copper chaperone PCu(A)C [Ilumatobacteraceae bacterium]